MPRRSWPGAPALYFADRHETCKHVWATVLAADAYGGLRAPGSTLPFRLVVKPVDRPAEPSAPAPPPKIQRPAPPAPRPAPPPAPPPREPTWREILNLLPARETPAPDPARGIVYVIDVPATIQTQDITVDLLTGRRKTDGAWGKLHPLRVPRSEILSFPDPADREILALLAGAEQGNSYIRWSSRPLIPSQCEIPASAAKVLIPVLCATGRCHVRLDPKDEDLGEPLVWEGGEPWQLWLEVREAPDGSCTVSPAFRRGEERMPLDEPVLLLQSSLLLTARRGFWFDDGGAFGWIPLLRRAGGILRAPRSDQEELLERLFAAPLIGGVGFHEACSGRISSAGIVCRGDCPRPLAWRAVGLPLLNSGVT